MTSYITHRVVSSHQLHETARATCIGISVLTKVRQAEITGISVLTKVRQAEITGISVLTKVRQAEITENDHDNFTNTEEEKQNRT